MGCCTLKKLSVCVILVIIFLVLRQFVRKLLYFEPGIVNTIVRGHVTDALKFDSLADTVGDHYQSSSPEPLLAKWKPTKKFVDVWSKASTGLYTWEHIFGASHEPQDDSWSYGEKTVKGITFRFYAGPGLVPESIPADTNNLVLIANGRNVSNINLAVKWLDYIAKHAQQFSSVALLMLGNELCDNTWITKYMVTAGGPVKVAFLVYDDPNIDDSTFYQWPLGVAMYRKFPIIQLPLSELERPRPYRCNFLGTIYANSSRETLVHVLRQLNAAEPDTCYLKERTWWLPNETPESSSEYVDALRNSDLTLNAVGTNSECYRIYEAMACGSVPVIEDVAVSPDCGTVDTDSHHRTVLRLLKRYQAPVIYVTDWLQLVEILERERKMTLREKVARRRQLLTWYRKFRRKMREVFVDVISRNFFGSV